MPLIRRMRLVTSASSASSTRSVLLSTMRSAKAICSIASFTTPSFFTSLRWRVTCLESTTVTSPSRRYCCESWSSRKNVWMMGAGLASPVVSMSTWSNLSRLFMARSLSMFTRSPRTVQQRQPLLSISTSSSPASSAATRDPSISISPNSFSMTAIRMPWSSFRILFSSVVFPEPRKPVMIVTGNRLSDPPRTSATSPSSFS
mmetsp:Transcript_3969/g.7733  ORF Transcript_3969/g.7733 Transcript_3969/m.7733 type:complete len:202 (+) Transcript_3969:1624-2229(+)